MNKLRKIPITLVSTERELTIDATDGTKTLNIHESVMQLVTSGIYSNIEISRASSPTVKMSVQIYEATAQATYSEIFHSFDVNKNNLCLTQHQIGNFVLKYTQLLNREVDGHKTTFLFLFKAREVLKKSTKRRLLVARVRIGESELPEIEWGTFNDSGKWFGMYSIVVPKL